MVPADFEEEFLYISGGRVANQLNIRGSVTRKKWERAAGAVGVVEEVVWPGKSGLAKPRGLSLCSHFLPSFVE